VRRKLGEKGSRKGRGKQGGTCPRDKKDVKNRGNGEGQRGEVRAPGNTGDQNRKREGETDLPSKPDGGCSAKGERDMWG